MNQGPPYPYPPPRQSSSSSAVVVIVVICAVIIPLIGTCAALAIYGVRRFISSSKTAEAKYTVGAISRAAVSAYERDSTDDSGKLVHALCDSTGLNAPDHGPVPATLPQAMKYMPSSAPGADFETGTSRGGWRCLKFTVSSPIYYQYHYNKGGDYLDPSSFSLGPSAFEAAARGDIDGDGVPSLFTRTGKVDAGGSVVLSTALNIENEFE